MNCILKIGPVAHLARASLWHREGGRFESDRVHKRPPEARHFSDIPISFRPHTLWSEKTHFCPVFYRNTARLCHNFLYATCVK